MSEGERWQRPEPERTEPLREFLNVLGAHDRAEGRESGSADGDGDGIISEAVRAAYQISDAYLRQGRRVAKEVGRLSYEPFAGNGNLRELPSRWLQLTSELIAVYFETVGSLAESAMALGGSAPAEGSDSSSTVDEVDRAFAGPDPAGRAPEVSVDYEVQAAVPVRLHAEFFPGRATTRLAATALRTLAADNGKVRVAFEPIDAQRVLVKLAVKEGQAPGLYAAALVDSESGLPVGSLSLKVG